MGESKPRRAREHNSPYAARAGVPSAQDLARLKRRLVRAAHPELIILFGSRVYGTPKPDSDLDVLVVTNEAHPAGLRALEIQRQAHPFPLSLDVHPHTPDELTHRLRMGDEFIQEIVGRGKQIYPARQTSGFAGQVRQALEQGRTHPMDNGELVGEWIEKAEGDFASAQVLMRQRKQIFANNLCWTCQQCAEKYFKAFLTRHRVKYGRTRNLGELVALCSDVDADFRLITQWIDPVAVCTPEVRYPKHNATLEQARAAFTAVKPIRKFVRAKLGLR